MPNKHSEGNSSLASETLRLGLRHVQTLVSQGRLDEASFMLEKAAASDPKNRDVLIELASVRRGQGRLQDAIELASQALSMNKQDPTAMELLLQLYLETGQYEQVIDRGQKVLKRSPRNLFARDLMGAAYLQLGKLDKALQMTNELVHLDPLDPGNHFKRAVLFQQKGDIGKALREFSRVLDLDPDGEMGDEARDAITWLDSYQIRQILSLALEDNLFRAKLLHDAENASVEKGFILSTGGMLTLRQIDFDRLLDPSLEAEPPTYH